MSVHLSPGLKQVQSPEAMAEAIAIRCEVFVEEQGVSEAEEIDGLDDQCDHIIYWDDDQAVGTARLRCVTDDQQIRWGKLERIAVRKAWRGKGIGRQLVEGLMELGAQQAQLQHFKLGSQCDAIPFYEKLGFEAYGEVFMDARIPHRMMKTSRL